MDRKEKLIKHINPNGQGIEIGPGANPIAPKKDGFKVHIIDHMSREQLLVKYKEHNLDLKQIEEVDFVWQGEGYADLTGKRGFYDWVIASHVIEHCPDLIGFLKGLSDILTDDGVVSLAIPDKRYCFDHFRPITSISKIIDAHLNKHSIHTPGDVAEYFLNVVSKGGSIAWSVNASGEYKFCHTLVNAIQGMNSVVNEKAYLDIHAWCFVPHSFRLIIHDLFSLGLIPLKELEFFQTEGCEFFMTLSKRGEGVKISRLEMLNIIESELVGEH